MPSDSARSSARSSAVSVPRRSPSRSRATASTSSASSITHRARPSGSSSMSAPEAVDRSLGVAVRHRDGRIDRAHLEPLTILGRDRSECSPRGCRVPHAEVRERRAAPRLDAEPSHVDQARPHALGRPEGRQRLVEPALSKTRQSPRVVDDQLGGRLAVGPDRTLAAVEVRLGLVKAALQHEPARVDRAGRRDDRVLAPGPVRLGDRRGFLREIEGRRQPAAAEKSRQREMREARDLQVRAFDPARERPRLLEVASRVFRARRPHLGDPEIHQRRGVKIVAERRAAGRLLPQRRLHRGHRVEDGRQVAAPPSERQPHHRQLELEARPAVGRDFAGQPFGDPRCARASSSAASGIRAVAATSASSGSFAGASSGKPSSRPRTAGARASSTSAHGYRRGGGRRTASRSPPARGGWRRRCRRCARATRRRSGAAGRSWRGQGAAARAGVGRRRGGGSETRCGRRRAQ